MAPLLLFINMSRYSRFDRERINKLFGKKHKIIKKPLDDRTFNFLSTSESVRNSTPFSSSNYITMQTVDRKRKYKQKLKFRCYQDEDVFGNEIFQFLKQQHEQEDDAESTYEKIKCDVSKGVNSLKEEIQILNLSKEKIVANED